jgi:ribosomal protein S18 acetylase RimI-like enzyme
MVVVKELAERIWPAVYPGIITQEQIRYMLDQRYALPVLEADLAAGAAYALIHDGGTLAGYVSYEVKSDHLFLGKLYLLPERSGCGLGQAALRWVREEGQRLGRSEIRLVVNKRNSAAIRAYRRAGFEFGEDVVTDIGSGFVMDDFRLSWKW